LSVLKGIEMDIDTWGYFKQKVEKEMKKQGCMDPDKAVIDFIDTGEVIMSVEYDEEDNSVIIG